MKIKWMVLVLMLSGLVAEAQYPYVTQYTQNYFLINPAVAGLDSSSQLLFWNRNNITTNRNLQFNSIQVGYHTPLQGNSSGVGFKLFMDQPIYASNRNISSFSGNYAYNFKFTDNTDIRIGLGMGVHRFKEETFTGQFQGDYVDYLFFYDFGVIFNLENMLIGMSAASANNPSRRGPAGVPNRPAAYVNRIISVMAQYQYEYSELVDLMPSVLLRNDGFGGDITLELKGEARLWNTFLVGLGYRFTRFGQIEINLAPYYTTYDLPNYLTIQVGGYVSDLIFINLSYDIPVNTNIPAPYSLIEGTVGLGL